VHTFLANNRAELIARCRAKVARRPQHAAREQQLAGGIPLFLSQLTRTLRAEEEGELGESMRISGASGGDSTALSEMGVSAVAHGKELLDLGYTVDQVVHDYGDLCQAITDLAFERDAPFTVDEFRTLNRCLDNAIADAVTEFSIQRDEADVNERLGVLAHELRNHVQTATMAFAALESGKIAIGGSTGGVLKRSLASLSTLLTVALAEVRVAAGLQSDAVFSLAAFVAEAAQVASLDAAQRGCVFWPPVVDPMLRIAGNRELLLAALVNLLQNGFKFTHPHSEVTLNAYGVGNRVLIEVHDHCGGLSPGAADEMFKPFTRRSDDKSGLGLGLSIARQSVAASGGRLSVHDLPGTGCVFTISLPRHAAA
jgi:signal transduction histidine kinase